MIIISITTRLQVHCLAPTFGFAYCCPRISKRTLCCCRLQVNLDILVVVGRFFLLLLSCTVPFNLFCAVTDLFFSFMHFQIMCFLLLLPVVLLVLDRRLPPPLRLPHLRPETPSFLHLHKQQVEAQGQGLGWVACCCVGTGNIF